MTIKEIAKLEKASVSMVRQWIWTGKLKATRTIDGYEITDESYKEFCDKCATGEIERRRKND